MSGAYIRQVSVKSGFLIRELSARSVLLREVTIRSGVHIKEVFTRRDLTVKAKHFRF